MPACILTTAERLCGANLTGAAKVAGSGNSQVYRLHAGTKYYALKLYPSPAEDSRDRLGQEFAALSFLHAQAGLGFAVPQPLGRDAEHRLGLYSWLDGVRPLPPAPADLQELAIAVKTFHAITAAPGASALPDAVEASLSALDLANQIAARLERFNDVRAQEAALDEFIRHSFDPLLHRCQAHMAAVYGAAALLPAQSLVRGQSVLSPSDFGLHNSLRLTEGGLALLDFEYFGWDDPVRMIVDVLCHPAMSLNQAQRRNFANTTMPVFIGDPAFLPRLRALAPLIALRWALIVLNEFLPHHWARRVQAGATADWAQAKRRQLDKAAVMLGLCEEFLAMDWI